MIEVHSTTRGMLPPLHTEVLVVGAGGAGTVAALAAGRNGAKTLLVEYQGFVGGISSTLTWLGFHDQEYRFVVKGIPLEIVRRLQANGDAGEFALDPKCSSALSLDTHAYKCLAVGTAAALAVKRRVSIRDVPIGELRNTLIDQGAELGQSLGEPDPAVIEEVGQLPKSRKPPTNGQVEQPTVAAEQWMR